MPPQELMNNQVHTSLTSVRLWLWLPASCSQVPVALVRDVLSNRPDTAPLNQKYDNFAMRSFIEENRALVWCTGEQQLGWCVPSSYLTMARALGQIWARASLE